ncbi:DUF2244 domain-containing protein [Acidovorax sp. RAC01]|uniref:DUF2244 domain-containing protein n=1 Tax=Acidovorax sp. RAC01 TaxID=1842533 RepID=UPI00083E7C6C|nr:DUF2244 domain-containing protein [Acidovorax sp. RAC01]AOG21588.1 hypothetical protein BSY15_2355 [Acidovorax sp. RAC01]
MTGLVYRFATVSGQRVDWRLARNCSVTPAQLGWLYLALCVVILAIASAFWMLGARLVMPFAWLEILAVGIAFVIYGRHAADGERISLQGSRLVVELETAGKLERAEFDRSRVRVEPKTGNRSLIMLSAQGRSVEVGRFVRPELRPVLASEIRMALRAA